jgi:hypothetical protein
MNLRSICLSLGQKGMSAIDIQQDTEATLGLSAISRSTVTKYLREAQIIHNSEPTPKLIVDEGQKLIDEAILPALAEGPFAFVRRIASKTLIPRSPVFRHLVGSLGMAGKHPVGLLTHCHGSRSAFNTERLKKSYASSSQRNTILKKTLSLPLRNPSFIFTQTLNIIDYQRRGT